MIENVYVTKKANIYFDGKCISHTMMAADGWRMSAGPNSRFDIET